MKALKITNIFACLFAIIAIILAYELGGNFRFLLIIPVISAIWIYSYIDWYFDNKSKNEKSYFVNNFKESVKPDLEKAAKLAKEINKVKKS